MHGRRITKSKTFNEKILTPKKASWEIWKGPPPFLEVYCYAITESHALRIAEDIRAYIDAAGLWDVLAASSRQNICREDISVEVRNYLEGLLAPAPEVSNSALKRRSFQKEQMVREED
jgi:hypothetical protein